MLRISWVEGLGFRVIDEVFFWGGGGGAHVFFKGACNSRYPN